MNNIGYDVEAFLYNARGFIPAERILSGSKGRGAAIGKGVLAHPDNVMAEFSSAAPFDSSTLFDRIIHDVDLMRNHIDPVELRLSSSVTLTDAVLAQSELADEIGCDADYQYDELRDPLSAWNLGQSRYAGGHIHFDINPQIPVFFAARTADVLLGSTLVALGEQQGGRRSFYGLPGLNRPKSYGFEYRTLSNYWVRLIMEQPENGELFCKLVHRLAMGLVEMDDRVLDLGITQGDLAAQIIASEDRDSANNLLKLVQQEVF